MATTTRLNGAKTFITGGLLADLVIVVARTARDSDDSAGLTLLVVEDGMAGFTKGRKLDKTRPAHSGHGRAGLRRRPRPGGQPARRGGQRRSATWATTSPQERLAIAVGAVASRPRGAGPHDRSTSGIGTVFGQPLSGFQNTKFELAAVATEIEAAQAHARTGPCTLFGAAS